MFRKYVLTFAAVFGVIFAVFVAVSGAKQEPPAPPVADPAQAPFRSYVAGAGILESNTLDIAIGTNVSGVITSVPHQVNDAIAKGDVLFTIDDRNLQAELLSKQAALESAKAQLHKLATAPRPEDVPVAEAKVKEAEANFQDVKTQYELARDLGDSRAMSIEDLSKRKYAMGSAEARLQQAQADLAELKAGTWKPDLDVAQASVSEAEAAVKAVQVDIERSVVRSPIDGKVLQCYIRPGMYAQAGALSSPLMIVGNITPMNVRVDVDENDAWRVAANAKAVAFVRGNRELSSPLVFDHFDPYVIPKKSLTGDTTERVDTRVLQVVYRLTRNELPIYVGQQMDIFIEAPEGGMTPTTRPAESAAAAQ